mgnify:CR=1 FL=1
MIIEKGIPADIDELEQLYNDLNDFLAADINHPGWIKGVYPTRQIAEKGIEEQSLYVVRHEGRIAGSIILNHHAEQVYDTASWGIDADYDKLFVIHTLVVHPLFLKAGIGKQLVAFACELGQKLQMKAIRLDTYEHNIPAIKLYEKFGFKYIDTIDLGLGDYGLHRFRLYEKIL